MRRLTAGSNGSLHLSCSRHRTDLAKSVMLKYLVYQVKVYASRDRAIQRPRPVRLTIISFCGNSDKPQVERIGRPPRITNNVFQN
jgi:hypothetical protein